jgi:hypothetical protein
MRNFDLNKPLTENFPELDFNISTFSISSLIDIERQMLLNNASKYPNYIGVWEYSYFFLWKLFNHESTLEKSYTIVAALFTEGYNSLRCAFKSNLEGYHSDSITLLRKTHESVVRAIACRIDSANSDTYILESGVQKSHSRFKGEFLNELYSLESSYAHAHRLKAMETMSSLSEEIPIEGVTYGPQFHEREFTFSLKMSLFWLYVMIKAASRLFTDQISQQWIKESEIVTEMIRCLAPDEDKFTKYYSSIDKCFENIGPVTNKINLN